MDVREFDFHLPPELVAQEPIADRSGSRLLYVDRAHGSVTHTQITALPNLLTAGDLIVVNNTRVFPARLLGHRVPSGGSVECLLVRRLGTDPGRSGDGHDSVPEAHTTESGPVDECRDILTTEMGRTRDGVGTESSPSPQVWEALMHPGQKLHPGTHVVFDGRRTIHGEVLAQKFFGRRVIRLWTADGSTLDEAIDAIGHVPLPPYIKRADRSGDRERYQTVYARERGSIAAPTAGLHFTPALIAALNDRGVAMTEITLHVGYGTFQPVRVERVEEHTIEAERYEITDAAADAITRALTDGRRVIAVGTTTTRTLEAVAQANDGRIVAGRGTTGLFIYPGFRFRVIGGLLTNFHVPKSSLLMLVAAFGGQALIKSAYDAAVAERYRFYSYGDAMLIL